MRRSKIKKVAIIPTLNEEENIHNVLTSTQKYVDGIIVVDSSTDDTPNIIKNNFPDVFLLRENKRGKGIAIRRGIIKALEFNPDFMIFLDADLEKDPIDIKRIIKNLKKNDIVIGKRDRMRSLTRLLLNSFTAWWIRIVTGLNITDATSGFIGLRTNVLKEMRLTSTNFEIEIEIILEAFKNNLRLVEVGIKVPKISRSKLRLKNMIEINIFFDEWVLRWLKEKKFSAFKEIFLYFFCNLGLLAKIFVDKNR